VYLWFLARVRIVVKAGNNQISGQDRFETPSVMTRVAASVSSCRTASVTAGYGHR
jgi:hypothetical protein